MERSGIEKERKSVQSPVRRYTKMALELRETRQLKGREWPNFKKVIMEQKVS